jgi:uncharacterized membrane protein
MASPDQGEASPRRVSLPTGRLEAFSDGVFAIAITLLVLEIGVRPDWQGNPLGAVVDLWPEYLAYVVSFATIGAIWLGHSAVTHYLEYTDPYLTRLNLLLLLAVSFLPFPTSLLGEFLSSESGERVATTVLGLNLFLANVLLGVFWRSARGRGLVHPDADDEELTLVTRRLTPGLAGYVLFIGVGLFKPFVAVVGYFLLALALTVPRRRPRRARDARRFARNA